MLGVWRAQAIVARDVRAGQARLVEGLEGVGAFHEGANHVRLGDEIAVHFTSSLTVGLEGPMLRRNIVSEPPQSSALPAECVSRVATLGLLSDRCSGRALGRADVWAGAREPAVCLLAADVHGVWSWSVGAMCPTCFGWVWQSRPERPAMRTGLYGVVERAVGLPMRLEAAGPCRRGSAIRG